MNYEVIEHEFLIFPNQIVLKGMAGNSFINLRYSLTIPECSNWHNRDLIHSAHVSRGVTQI